MQPFHDKIHSLLGHGPRYEVPRRPFAPGQALHDALLGYFSFQADLDDAEHFWQDAGVRVCGAEQAEQVVGGGVRHHLQVVGGVLVVRRDVKRHDTLEEGLRGLVVAEQGVPVDVVQVAVLAGWAARGQGRDQGGVQAQQTVQPVFDGVSRLVPETLKESVYHLW